MLYPSLTDAEIGSIGNTFVLIQMNQRFSCQELGKELNDIITHGVSFHTVRFVAIRLLTLMRFGACANDFGVPMSMKPELHKTALIFPLRVGRISCSKETLQPLGKLLKCDLLSQ